MKKIMQVILTNWVNLLVLVSVVFIYAFILAYSDKTFDFGQSLFSATYLTFLYGMMFWAGFIVSIVILDALLFGLDKKIEYVNIKLIVEWVIISSPFVYWLIKYNQWVFLAAIIAFLIGQMIRKPMILKILTE